MRMERTEGNSSANPSSKRDREPTVAVAASTSAHEAGVIDQVRELLFGETNRSAEKNISALDAKVDALAATMHARFLEVENRITELTRDTERAQAAAIDEIGDAIAQLGASIRKMSGVRRNK
jgi:hypothetical protein